MNGTFICSILVNPSADQLTPMNIYVDRIFQMRNHLQVYFSTVAHGTLTFVALKIIIAPDFILLYLCVDVYIDK